MTHTLAFHTISLAKKIQKNIYTKDPGFSLSFSEASALLIVDSSGQTSQSDIAARLNLEPASVVTLIDKLEQLKLVKRTIISTNRRKHRIDLTPKGKLVVTKIKKRTKQLDNFLRENLGEKEFQNLHAILEKLDISIDSWKNGYSN